MAPVAAEVLVYFEAVSPEVLGELWALQVLRRLLVLACWALLLAGLLQGRAGLASREVLGELRALVLGRLLVLACLAAALSVALVLRLGLASLEVLGELGLR